MGRNCLIAIAVWIALFAGYSFLLFHAGLPFEGALLGGAMMSFLVGLGLAMVNSGRFALRDRRALERFQRGERPHDGQLVAVSGEIRATFEPLRAPFSGRECVGYRYDIGPPASRGQTRARDYAGFAFARCAIHSPLGTFPLGSFPVLSAFPEQRHEASRVQAYVDATEFEPFSSVLALAKYTIELHQQALPLRVDWQLGDAPERMDGAEAKELIVESGATVTAYGVYSAATSSLVSGRKSEGYLRLFPGVTATLPPTAIPHLVVGTVLVVVANVGMWIVLSKLSML